MRGTRRSVGSSGAKAIEAIGGYFELEVAGSGKSYHEKATHALKSARAGMRMLAEQYMPKRVWIPHYSCDALLEPLSTCEVPLSFYAVNECLEIEDDGIATSEGEYVVYVNYFGLTTNYAARLEKLYGDRLWIDNTQAFFVRPEVPKSFHFNSARKFFGVPDGAFLYGPSDAALPPADSWPRNTNYCVEHLVQRWQGRHQEGHAAFMENERLCGGDIARISEFSEALLKRIDYDEVARSRRENYRHLHRKLSDSNRLSRDVTTLDDDAVPFCYPYLPPRRMEKQYFWDRNVFIPVLWRECLTRSNAGFAWEKRLSSDLLPLPIDHRSDQRDMDRILQLIDSYE